MTRVQAATVAITSTIWPVTQAPLPGRGLMQGPGREVVGVRQLHELLDGDLLVGPAGTWR